MQPVREDRHSDVEAPADDRSAPWATLLDPRRIVLCSLALFVALRCWVVLAADTPTVTPDELGAWAIARFLTGQDALISMRDMPRYSLMSGVALSPVAWLDLDPVAAYRLALVLLSASTVAAAEVVRRTIAVVLPDRRTLGALAFATTLLFPATFVTGSFTWAEPTALLWWALLAWGVAHLATRPGPFAVVAGSLVAGLAPSVHGRFSAVPLIWLVALGARAVTDRRRQPDPGAVRLGPGLAALGAATTVVTVLAAGWLDRVVEAAVWSDGAPDAVATGTIATGPWWRALVVATVGQSWYLVVASVGLAALGVALLVDEVRRPSAPGRRLLSLTLAAMLASNVAISVVASSDGLTALFGVPSRGLGGLRWDHLVYGRYVDAAALILAVLGLVRCWDPARRRSNTSVLAVAGGAAIAVAVVGTWRTAAWEPLASDSLDLTIAGVAWTWPFADGLALAPWTLLAAVVMAGLAVALRRGHGALVAVVGVWLVVGAVAATMFTLDRHHEVVQADLAPLVGEPGPAGTSLVVATDAELLPSWRLGIFAQQRDLAQRGWHVQFDRGDSEQLAGPAGGAAPPAALLLVDGIRPDGDGWRPVARFRDATIWRR